LFVEEQDIATAVPGGVKEFDLTESGKKSLRPLSPGLLKLSQFVKEFTEPALSKPTS
jgi:hypothetical protein